MTEERLTKAVRAADLDFESVGGSSRHYVRECLMPALDAEGLMITDTDARVQRIRDIVGVQWAVAVTMIVDAEANTFACEASSKVLKINDVGAAYWAGIDDGSDGLRRRLARLPCAEDIVDGRIQ